MSAAHQFLQFLRYGASGAAATTVQILVFYLFAWKVLPSLRPDDPVVRLLGLTVSHVSDAARPLNSMIANGVAFFFANTTAYLINIAWVFEPGRHHRLVEIALFYLVSGASVLIGTISMGLMIQYLDFQTTSAFFANVGICLVLNYLFRKFVIFNG